MYTTIEDLMEFLCDILVMEYDSDISYKMDINHYSKDDIISITSNNLSDEELANIDTLTVLNVRFSRDYIEELLNYDFSIFHYKDRNYNVDDTTKLSLNTELLLAPIINSNSLGELKSKIINAFYDSGILEDERLLGYEDYNYLIDLIIYNKKLKKVDTSNMC